MPTRNRRQTPQPSLLVTLIKVILFFGLGGLALLALAVAGAMCWPIPVVILILLLPQVNN